MRSAVIGKARLVLLEGDITKMKVDAIVNAANPSLMGGGGVDGAIHRAGGPQILEECREIVANQGRLPTGQAVITTAGNLSASRVIHTVGPIWRGGGGGEEDLLRNAYRTCLELACENSLRTIAFPSISTGAYRFPVEKAARAALDTVIGYLRKVDCLDEVSFVLFNDDTCDAYSAALDDMFAR